MAEERTYVGGVVAEQREPEEIRADELGVEGMYWTGVRTEVRVDDLEGAVGETERDVRAVCAALEYLLSRDPAPEAREHLEGVRRVLETFE